MLPSIKTGTIIGNGAAQTISIGFVPDYLRIINVTDGNVVYEWTPDMAAANALKSQNVVDNAATGNSSLALIIANGVTAFAGSSTAAAGFTIGTAISVNAKTLAYQAYRNVD